MPEDARDATEEQHVNALLAAVEGYDERATRNRAIVLLLYESGMRVSELCALRDRDVQLKDRAAKVVSKGRRFRWAFWDNRGAMALATYLNKRSGSIGGPLFRGCSSRNDGGPMTRNAVRAMLKRLEVAQLVGHRDIRTTMIYARRNPERLRRAHCRIFDKNRTSGDNQRGQTQKSAPTRF